MTYIEFFDNVATENISTCLTYHPQRVIYIGDNSGRMIAHVNNYKAVLEKRGITGIEFIFKTAQKSKFNNVVQTITEIVETYEDCVFDISGGDEIFILALGMVYGKYPDKNIQIHKFNLKSNKIYDCDNDNTDSCPASLELSVRENINIYGGDVVMGGVEEDKTYEWDLNDEFLKDFNAIWDIYKEIAKAKDNDNGNTRIWNFQMAILSAMNKRGEKSSDGLVLSMERGKLENVLNNEYGLSYKPLRVFNMLVNKGLLTCFNEGGGYVTVAFKNSQVKRCLINAGTALEMKVFITAKFIEKGGVPAYNDALNGVFIDWDGKLHNEEEEDIYDTENEIDVFLMHGIIPIFISCKNGNVTAEELYKLNTVAARFGGPYAKKVLVAPAIETLENSKFLIQRAKDMNIKIIKTVNNDAELVKSLKNLWDN